MLFNLILFIYFIYWVFSVPITCWHPGTLIHNDRITYCIRAADEIAVSSFWELRWYNIIYIIISYKLLQINTFPNLSWFSVKDELECKIICRLFWKEGPNIEKFRRPQLMFVYRQWNSTQVVAQTRASQVSLEFIDIKTLPLMTFDGGHRDLW